MTRLWALSLLCALLLPAQTAWTQWGGPNRNFIVDAVPIADSWPASGPRLLWKRPLGEGYSSLLIENGVLYTMYGTQGREVVLAADAQTGKTLWEHSTPISFRSDAPEMGNGPYATGLLVRDRLVTAGATGLLQCLDKKSGKPLWTKHLDNDFKATRLVYGYASSPIAYRDLLIVPAGGKGRALIAFRISDGSIAWQALDFTNAYSSPVLINVDGLDQLVTLMDGFVFAVNPLNGDLQWQIPHHADYGLNVSTPLWLPGNRLFVSAEYDAGSRMIALRRDGNRVLASQLWDSNKLRLHHGNAIPAGGNLYFSSGGKGSVAILTTVEIASGKILNQNRTFSKATFVQSGGKIIVIDQDGDLALAKPGPQGLDVISRASLLTSNAWTPPTLAGSRLYLRDRNQMMALDLSK
jgi:outer membrane protein assembly factor BamB